MDRLRRYAEFFGTHVDNPPVSEQQKHEATATDETSEQQP